MAAEALKLGLNFGYLQGLREAFPDTAFTVVARGRDLANDIPVARRKLRELAPGARPLPVQ